MVHVYNLEASPKDIAQNKSLFIDFKGLHIGQHVTIVPIKSFYLLIVVFGFF